MEVVRRRDQTIVRVPNRNAQALVMYCVVWPVAWMYLPIVWIHLAGVVVLFALLSANSFASTRRRRLRGSKPLSALCTDVVRLLVMRTSAGLCASGLAYL